MKYITGLGNPGTEYQLSRHNVGFMILDAFATARKMTFKKEGNSLQARRSNFTLLKPQTYMNLSGKALANRIEESDSILVICDDIYLPFGEIRLRCNGGDGGHNGLKSIISELSTDEFFRMRIGVGQPAEHSRLSNYVLEDFSDEELKSFEHVKQFAIKLIDCFIASGFQSVLNFYSKNKKSYSEKLISESLTIGGK